MLDSEITTKTKTCLLSTKNEFLTEAELELKRSINRTKLSSQMTDDHKKRRCDAVMKTRLKNVETYNNYQKVYRRDKYVPTGKPRGRPVFQPATEVTEVIEVTE
jgi:hypothetical protein